MAEVQELKVKISVEDKLTDKMKKAQKELDKVSSSANETGEKLKQVGNAGKDASAGVGKLDAAFGAIQSGAIAAALVKITKSLTDLAAKALDLNQEFQHLGNLMDFTFGEGSDDLTDFATSLGKIYGMNFSSAASALTQFTQLGQSIGLAKDDATKLAESFAKLGAQYEAAFGQGSEALSAFEAAIRGNYRALTKIGIVLTDAKLEAIAMSYGITASADAWDETTRAALVYQAIMQETAGVAAIAADSTGSWAVATSQFTNELSTMLNGLGGWLSDFLVPVMQQITAVLAMFNSILGFTNKATKASNQLANSTGAISGSLDKANAVSSNLSKNLGGANKSAKELKKTMLGFDEMTALNDNGSIGSLGAISFNMPDYSGLLNFADIFSQIDAATAEADKSLADWTLSVLYADDMASASTLAFQAIAEEGLVPFALQMGVSMLTVNDYAQAFAGVFEKLPKEVQESLKAAGIENDRGLAQLAASADLNGQSLSDAFGEHYDEILGAVETTNPEIYANMKENWGNIGTLYEQKEKDLIDMIQNGLNFILLNITTFGKKVQLLGQNIWLGIMNVVQSVFDGIGSAIIAIQRVVQGVTNSILGFVEGVVNEAIRTINVLIDSYNQRASFFGIAPVAKLNNVSIGRTNYADDNAALFNYYSSQLSGYVASLENSRNATQQEVYISSAQIDRYLSSNGKNQQITTGALR